MRDRAARDLLDLAVEHMYGRFGPHDEESHDHSGRDQHPVPGEGSKRLSDEAACRHEADVDTGQKQDQTGKGIEGAHTDADHVLAAETAAEQLKGEKEDDDRQQCQRNFFRIRRQFHDEGADDVLGRFRLDDRKRCIGGILGMIDDAQQQDGHDRSDAAKGDHAEVVLFFL